MMGAGALLGAIAGSTWVRRNFVVITVDGMSMSPALYPGQKVLVRRGVAGVSRGRIVVVAEPDPETGWSGPPPKEVDLAGEGWCIKRVAAVSGEPFPARLGRHGQVPDGHVIVLGDHPRSRDSVQYGPCPIDRVLGVQVRKLSTQETPTEVAVV